MALFKNPFGNKNGKEQFTPDLASLQKAKRAEKKLTKSIEDASEKAREAVEGAGKEKLQSVEGDKPSQVPVRATTASTKPQAFSKSPELVKIESILSENLEEIYFEMDEAHRRLFKEEGERVARQIELIIHSGKSVAVKILEVIKRWLSFIPGVNKFFIEQEAKIKTDKVLNDLGPQRENE